jgi:hypothetical protein
MSYEPTCRAGSHISWLSRAPSPLKGVQGHRATFAAQVLG